MGLSTLPARKAAVNDQPESGIAVADFREAMSRLAGGVCIVTTNGPAGLAGFTASAVCSVSDSPATMLVCVNRGASAYPAFEANGFLCVNMLSPSQQATASLFGGKTPMADRFAAAAWKPLASGAPALLGASASVDCRVVQRCIVGSHEVLICEAMAIATAANAPGALVYLGRRYHTLEGQAAA